MRILTLRTRLLTVAAGTLLLLSGCGSSTPSANDANPNRTDTQAADLEIAGHPHSPIGHLLRGITLSAEQQEKIKAISAEFKGGAKGHEARLALRSFLADEVARGTIDSAKLDEKLAAITAEQAANISRMQDAFIKTHAILTKEQREQVATRIENHAHGPKGHHGRDGAKDEKGERPEHKSHDNSDDDFGPGDEASEGAGPGVQPGGAEGAANWRARFAELRHKRGPFADLDLTDAQKEKLHNARKQVWSDKMKRERPNMPEHARALASAFRRDTLTAADLPAPPKFIDPKAHVTVLQAILPDLTEAQRTKLAAHMRTAKFEGHPGKHAK
jgi:Spy/CpxP family protein refolding chaperone